MDTFPGMNLQNGLRALVVLWGADDVQLPIKRRSGKSKAARSYTQCLNLFQLTTTAPSHTTFCVQFEKQKWQTYALQQLHFRKAQAMSCAPRYSLGEQNGDPAVILYLPKDALDVQLENSTGHICPRTTQCPKDSPCGAGCVRHPALMLKSEPEGDSPGCA